MILLWGIQEDTPLLRVQQVLIEKDVPFVFLDHRKIWQTEINMQFSPLLTGEIKCGELCASLNEIQAAYLRPYDFRMFPNYSEGKDDFQNPQFQYAANVEDILWSWAEITPILVLNRPSRMLSNNSKPYQMHIIKECGFDIPDTILTTNPKCVEKFKANHKQVIYKSISGIRSIVKRLGIEKLRDMEKVVWCPTQFQDYVNGTNFRVHVVGDRIFSTKIISEADDYRYERAILEACELPDEVKQKCIRLSKTLELPLCGIDFKVTPDSRWVCFEANPSPAYSYYQDNTGQKISSAIVDLLLSSKPES